VLRRSNAKRLVDLAIWVLPQFLTASQAHGDPISAAILTLIGGPINLLATGSTTLLLSYLGAGIAAALPGLLLSTAVSVGASLLSNALTPQSQAAQATPSQRMVNLRQTSQSRTRSYGRVRTGGPVLEWKASGGKRYVCVALNSGEVDAIETHYFGERTATLDGSGYATDTAYQSGGSSCIQVETFLGGPSQTTPTLLSGTFAEWDSSHKLAGIAGAVIAYRNPASEDFSVVYPDGREPTYAPVYRGARCYDPRLDSTMTGGSGPHRLSDPTTWEWTMNAALIKAHWLYDEDGLGTEVDWDLVMTEADAADVVIQDRDGNNIAKWELSGTYSFDTRRADVRSAMDVACDAMNYETDEGKQAFYLGRWVEPAYTITDVHIISGSLSEGQDGTTRPNSVVAQFTDPAAGYRENDAAAFYESDGEAYEEDHIGVLWAPRHNQAVRIAKRYLRAKRSQYEVSLKLKLYGLVLRTERFFRLEWDELGISATFEIGSWQFTDNGMGIAITAKSVLQDDFDFDAATEEPSPSTIAAESGTVVIEDATSVVLTSPAAGQLHVAFDAPTRSGIFARVRYRVDGAADWLETAPNVGVYYVDVYGLAAEDYEAQVQWRTASVQGDWIASTPTTITVASTLPSPVTGATATGGTGDATFNWMAPNSPNYAGAYVYTGATAVFASATKHMPPEYGTPNAADSVILTLAAGTYYAWITAVSTGGTESVETATDSGATFTVL